MAKTKQKKTNKGIKNFKNNKLIIAIGIILILLICSYVFRGWIRVTVIPKTDGFLYLGSINSELNKQSDDLGNPMSSLGFVNVTRNKSCSLQIAQSVHTDVDCEAILQSYVKLPSNLSNEIKTASQIQTSLIKNGWTGGTNGVTLKSLIDGIPQGKDYSPDAFYENVINKNNCIFDVMIAYSNPHPPAIRATFSCDRTLDFLGSPKQQTYFSSHMLD